MIATDVKKVRCDERPGVCKNCEKLGLLCTGAAPFSGQISVHDAEAKSVNVTPGIKRKRTFRSCTACRASKTRCSGGKPVCVRCQEKSVRCDYEDLSEPAWKQQLKYTGILRLPTDASQSVGEDSVPPQSDYDRQQSGDTSDSLQTQRYASADHDGNEMQRQPHQEYACLYSTYLPDIDKVRALVEYYFINVHPLRCFGFLHKPSFMQRLDAGSSSNRDEDALLHIVCALGALFVAAESEEATEPPTRTLAAGSQWAKRAQHLILTQLGDIAVENLMAAILLHDYELRMGNFGNAFMLSGITARMAQALQINLEHSTDVLCHKSHSGPGASAKESRRRLMWCCYITDSMIGNGVDQLTLIKEADLKIQLPCSERSFLLQTACVTEVLQPGQFLDFLPPEVIPARPMDNMGIRAYYIRYIAIRRKVLK